MAFLRCVIVCTPLEKPGHRKVRGPIYSPYPLTVCKSSAKDLIKKIFFAQDLHIVTYKIYILEVIKRLITSEIKIVIIVLGTI